MVMHELLTVKEMYEADRLTISGGTSGIDLMENAGVGVVEVINAHWPDVHHVTVLCGPGNNGGDGYVVARLLAGQGCLVRLVNVLPEQKLQGDAAIAAERYRGEVAALSSLRLEQADLIVDAMFGAGLSRDLTDEIARCVGEINDSDIPVLSIDIPSGIDGDSGAVRGCAIRADHTVTFFRHKIAHMLLPGKSHCGPVTVKNIGIADDVLMTILPRCFANEPGARLKRLAQGQTKGDADQHKYSRGHVLALSGGQGKTGAGRLAARGALRAGAGLVSVACPPDALAENAAQLTAIMIKVFANQAELETLLQDRRLNSVVAGPGLGVGRQTRQCVDVILKSGAKTVIDADGLTSFSDKENAADLFAAIKGLPERDVVLTPHQGEFDRLFGVLEGSKLDKAKAAAGLSGAVLVFKGPDTVIAAPDGVIAINANAPASLATAGSGDVLEGIIAGLIGQGMSGYKAACAGVWMHGRAATLFGPGLIAEDLPEMLPKVWSELS